MQFKGRSNFKNSFSLVLFPIISPFENTTEAKDISKENLYQWGREKSTPPPHHLHTVASDFTTWISHFVLPIKIFLIHPKLILLSFKSI